VPWRACTAQPSRHRIAGPSGCWSRGTPPGPAHSRCSSAGRSHTMTNRRCGHHQPAAASARARAASRPQVAGQLQPAHLAQKREIGRPVQPPPAMRPTPPGVHGLRHQGELCLARPGAHGLVGRDIQRVERTPGDLAARLAHRVQGGSADPARQRPGGGLADRVGDRLVHRFGDRAETALRTVRCRAPLSTPATDPRTGWCAPSTQTASSALRTSSWVNSGCAASGAASAPTTGDGTYTTRPGHRTRQGGNTPGWRP
jgi:hypothetical protein